MPAQLMPATQDEAVARLRPMVGEPDIPDANFTGDALWQVCGRHTTLEGAAAEVWQTKAAMYAEMVSVSEGGSRRELGQLHSNALRMAQHYNAAAVVITAPVERPAGPRTRAIERP